jgi:hypothetical protein
MVLTLVLSARAIGGDKHTLSGMGSSGLGGSVSGMPFFDCNVVEHIASLDNVANLKRNLHIVLHSRNDI